jgi:threonyl-tRNA synthetase
LNQLEEAKKRDHRKLGRDLEIFIFDEEEGPGLPLWLPNGGILIEELEKLAKEMEEKAGYVRVRTPNITKEDLFIRSGHLPYYAESMYPPMELEGVKYYIKPMNCPMHHKIFGSKQRSYRDLPVRLAEYGTCYRYEKSGELFGLMRVRSMQMNERLWLKTEDMVRRAMTNGNVPFVEQQDEAAFYGPKIDVQIWSVIGREFSLATNQVDFAVPERFDLKFVNKEGGEDVPLCIHRAPLSTHERMVGFLLEHYAGNFPVWLSPEQVRVIPITDGQNDYALQIEKDLRAQGIRVSADLSAQRMNAKIRGAQLMKVPYMLVVGENEMKAGQVSLRARDGSQENNIPLGEFAARAKDRIARRAAEL